MIGPLYDGMIVNSHSLSPLMRATCLTFYQSNKTLKPNYKKPYVFPIFLSYELILHRHVARRNQIEEICSKYRVTEKRYVSFSYFETSNTLSTISPLFDRLYNELF